jgi:hypothetical protein
VTILFLLVSSVAGQAVRLPAGERPAGGWPLVIVLGDDDPVRFLSDGMASAVLPGFDLESPGVSGRIFDLRRSVCDAKARTFAPDVSIDVNRVFIVPPGVMIRQDVEFARDDERVLSMDVIYPMSPASPVPTLMEITCDNVNRMGGFSLLYCQDTLIENALIRGWSAAMIDHPVRPPYKGIDDPMPQSLDRARAAVTTLRGMAGELNIDGAIVAAGFSRGGPFAAMLASTGDVEAALVHGNRFDFARLAGDDPMWARFEKAWGPVEANRERWLIHGAVHHLTDACSPMVLNTSDTESKEYREGLKHLHEALTARKIEHLYHVDVDGRGHKVTLDDRRMDEMFAFFSRAISRQK